MNKYEVQIRQGAGLRMEKVEAKHYTWNEHSVSFFGDGRHPRASFDPRAVVSVMLVQAAESE